MVKHNKLITTGTVMALHLEMVLTAGVVAAGHQPAAVPSAVLPRWAL